ncbi:hypothetical protein JCM11251_000451 [Rhodosporidiobolus azoricus]
MVAPSTPSCPRTNNVFPPVSIGPLARGKNPPEPRKGLSPLATKAPFSPKALDGAGAVFSAADAVKVAPSEQKTSDGWVQKNGVIEVVSAPLHEKKLSATCSWLHMYEHARWLHAGLPQGAISWPSYPYQIADKVEHEALRGMHAYLSSGLSAPPVKLPDFSLWNEIPHCESKDELQAAFMNGTIHFTGSISMVRDQKKVDRLIFRLNPPAAAMGSALYRRFGSDRFFRISLEDEVTRRAAPSFDSGRTSPSDRALQEQIKTFFTYPLLIFGRKFRSFCWKDGAAVLWCESGPGLKTIPLVDFAQRYLEVELNKSMSVAKYAARFELGLTTTTPTVTFTRRQVFRTPDLNSDSLKISAAAMKAICDVFRKKYPDFAAECLPSSYLPSCIRGTIQQFPGSPSVDMVWQLDYSPSSLSAAFPDTSIQAYAFASEPSFPTRPILKFSIEAKDGEVKKVQGPARLKVAYLGQKEVKKLEDEVVMTDGCSLMSFDAMKFVAEKAEEARGGSDLRADVPAVAQGRIGGGKGVWAVAPSTPWSSLEGKWIEIRDSQWKFKVGKHISSFTFELHSLPGVKSSTKLGKQFFEVAAHCGVPSSTFCVMLRQQVDASLDAFLNPPSNAALLYHVEKSSCVLEDRTMKARQSRDPSSVRAGTNTPPGEQDEADAGFVHDRRLDPSSGAPNTVAEVVVELLQAGFDPSQNPHLADKLYKTVQSHIRKRLGWKIDDEYSRTAFVVADHLGILKEGEFFFQISEPMTHPSGRGTTFIVDGPALLSRSPAIQPCDIQRATGVYKNEYVTYRDVIIVSTQGERSLCSILSGGDYDGDKLVVCANPLLVNTFNPSLANPFFADPPFADSDWFEVDRRKVKDCVTPLVKAKEDSALSAIFMEGLFQGTQYGVLSTWHTTLAYKLGLDDPLTSEVGHLFCRALDGRKQGLRFSEEKWLEAKAKFFEPHRHKPKWTFCEDGAKAPHNTKFAQRSKEKGKHAMDELVNEGEEVLKAATARWAEWCAGRRVEVDDDLANEWCTAWSTALKARESGAAAALDFFDDLEKIRDHIRNAKSASSALFASWARDKDRKLADEKASNAPGSPSKASPTKRKDMWRASSRSQKEDLLELSKQFWGILEDGRLKSDKLRGRDGARMARALIASCAYIDLLQPTPAPPAVGEKSLLDRFSAAISTSARSTSLAPSTATSISAVLVSPAARAPAVAPVAGTELALTIASPEDEDEEFHDAEEDSYGDDLRWSQIPDGLSQVAAAGAVVSSTTSSTLTTTAVPSSHPSCPASPAITTYAISTTLLSAPVPTRLPPYIRDDFINACKRSEIRFVYDMAHRDVLALKADAITRRLHGGDGAGAGKGWGTVGIQAPKIAPTMLDVLSVNKRCAGITKARAKVRPRTLLPLQEEEAKSPSVVGGSPAKKRRVEG